MAKGKTPATSTAVAVSGNTPVFEALQKVNKALKGLAAITEKTPKTSSVMSGFTRKVSDETDIQTLVKMMSSVSGRQKAYDEAHGEHLADVLPTAPVPKFDGHTFAEWKDDIRRQIQYITHKEKYDQLKKLKEKYTELMGKEEQLALLNKQLENVADQFGLDISNASEEDLAEMS